MRALLALLVLATSARAAPTPDALVLRQLNAHRKAAGLAPVVLDATLSQGCMEHAEYLRRNAGSAAIAGMSAHTQEPKLPGATPAGAACAKAADLVVGADDLAAVVEMWIAGIYHRRPMLDPLLTRIGFGYSQLPDGRYAAALVFGATTPTTSGWPVAYPGSGQSDVPLDYGAEIPNPIPANGRGGYATTLQFPPFDRVTGVRASLSANGAPVGFRLSDPEHPATSFPQSGVVSLIPTQMLDPWTTYTVSVAATWNGKRQAWTWSFTTGPLYDDE